MLERLRYLLLQVRNPGDPMAPQEIRCFARALHGTPEQIRVHDLLQGAPSMAQLNAVDVVLLGGSGDYSVAQGGPWIEPALETMRDLHARRKPTFASCWGFQAMAKALGGAVVTDPQRAELGTLPVRLTAEGADDPVFGPLAPVFRAQMGHQDIVDRLPPAAVRLASTDLVENQAFCLRDVPIYCTQFHPELNRQCMLERVQTYPQYVHKIAGMSVAKFAETVVETPETEALLRRFLRLVFGD